jgi:peptide/nickel transport system substrate-binding protein
MRGRGTAPCALGRGEYPERVVAMKGRGVWKAAVTVIAISLVASICAAASASPTKHATAQDLPITTPAGTKPVEQITWALTALPTTLDPIHIFNYNNISLSLLCESVLRQAPNGAITPGLATYSFTNPKTLVLTLRPGVKFWDGTPVTPADVVYSLTRNTNPTLGGFFADAFNRVQSISATGKHSVTIKLKRPDYWLPRQLSSTPGVIVEKAYVKQAGTNYGTPTGGIMCTGPYKLLSWKVGDVLSVVRNDGYWNHTVKPLVREIDFKAISVPATITAAFLNGSVQGMYYPFGLPTLLQLRQSSNVTVTVGAGETSDNFIISSLQGALGDVRVRRALSLAFDRQGIINATYSGTALLPKAFQGPGSWGYAPSVFRAGYKALPFLKQNIAEAKQLIAAAGASGKTINLAFTPQIPSIATEASMVQNAAEAIGLKVQMDSMPAVKYFSLFNDPTQRAGIDGFFTVNYADFADPGAWLYRFAHTSGTTFGGYSEYNNPKATALLNQARATADDTKRAQLVVAAQKLIIADLPWIPIAVPDNVLLTSSNLTGAVASFSFMFAPWADHLGGK